MQTQQENFVIKKNKFQSALVISVISFFLSIILAFVVGFTLDMEYMLGLLTFILLIIQIFVSLSGVIVYSKDMESTKPSNMYLCVYFFMFSTFLVSFLTMASIGEFEFYVEYIDEWGWDNYRYEFQTTALILWILYLCFMGISFAIYGKVASQSKKEYLIYQQKNIFLNPLNIANQNNNNGYIQQQQSQSLQQYQAPIEGIPLQIDQRPASLVVQGQPFTQNQQQTYQYQQPQQQTVYTGIYQ